MRTMKTYILKTLFYTALIIFCLVADYANATRVEITISKKIDRKTRVTLLPFFAKTSDSTDILLARELFSVLSFDLRHAGYFELWPEEKLPESVLERGIQYQAMDFDFWLDYATEIVIKGSYNISGSSVTIEMYCYDMATRSTLFARTVSGERSELRYLAHKISGAFIESLSGGRPSITTSKISYVVRKGVNSEIYVMDYDGQNPKQVTFENSLAINPEWLHDSSGFLYVSYRNGYPLLYLKNLTSSNIKLVSGKPGLNVHPAVSPDGKKIALTMSFNGNPEIYIIDLNGEILQRVTYDPAVDSSPTWAPDSRRLAFVSDRSGTPQIYVADYLADTVKRVTYRGTYNTSPSWNPIANSPLIVYTSMYGKNTELYLVDINTGDTRRLTTTLESEEDPSWAPDGIHISYTLTQNYRSFIYFMDVRDCIPICLTETETDSRASSWGPAYYK